ncbi:sulfurtransferase [Ammoniphilus sp. CFH 90114]|uniref:sulfurtransferase n=1 Tax=Ammoniphilus sp. CFH 90114 TaxID=2493665 RepID=UPI00100E7167|nr:sulfurtransferase [Ammoniphilus sp. CFH 90114]RXT08752.1 sulfurtransferase [Ammoniphilus sp. CFH 90114]
MSRYLVTSEWLKERLDNSQVRIVDCRFILGNPGAGKQAYEEGHIQGAVYFDLEQDMSGTKGRHGGRHPLPPIEEFVEKLSQAGIGNQTTVVAYDDQGGAMASRFWWLLHYLGHENVYVLSEGYTAWKEKDYPTTIDIPSFDYAPFKASVRQDLVVDMSLVKEKKGLDEVVLIDSREERRYKGIEEQIDPVAGHIPGAQNYFWKGVLGEKGTWKEAEELAQQFKSIDRAKEIIVYCGSGVTACPNILGLKEAGYENVKLYPGSWSDWCSYADNPVGKEKE